MMVLKLFLLGTALLTSTSVAAESWRVAPHIMIMYEAARLIEKKGLDINYNSDGDDWPFDFELSVNSPLFLSRQGGLRHTFAIAKADYGGLKYTLYETGINGKIFRYVLSRKGLFDAYLGAGVGALKATSWFEAENFKTGSVKVGVEGRLADKVVFGIEWYRRWSEAKLFNSRIQKLDTGGFVLKAGFRF